MTRKNPTVRLAVYALLASATPITTAIAADSPGESKKVISIPAGDLNTALESLVRETGIQLLYDLKAVEGLRTPGVKGAQTPQAALSELLEGTKLKTQTDRSGALLISDDRVRATSDSEGGGEDERPAQRQKVIELEEIVVTGTHIRGAEPTGSSLTVYSREDIDRSGAGNVPEFLRTIPQNLGSIDAGTSQVRASGADLSSNAWFGATVNLHGLGSGATLILLNGQRMAPAGGEGEFVDVSLIPLSAVERIEVLSDGASAIYGADAVAGVVNFILRKDYEGAETTVRFGDSTRGGASEISASQVLGHRWDGGSTMLVYEHRDQEELVARQRDFVPVSETGVIGDFTLLPSQRQHSFFATARQSLRNRTALFAQGFWSKRDFDQSSLIGNLGAGRTESYIAGYAEQLGGSIGLTQELPAQWNLEVVATQSRMEQDLVQRNVAQNRVQPLNFVSALIGLDVRADGPIFRLPAGAVRASVGLSGRREGMDVAARSPVPALDLERDVFSGYGEVLLPLLSADKPNAAPRLALSLAGRYDHYGDFGSATQPKVGLSWRPVGPATLRASYSRSYKAPTLTQRYETGNIYQLASIPNAADPDGVTETMLFSGLGNADLQPERARSWSVGFDYKPGAVPGLSVSATYFNVKFSDRVAGPPLMGGIFAIYDEPALASFISRDISPAEIDRILAEEVFENFSGPDFSGSVDPHLTEAIFDFHSRNIATTKESGLDFSANYAFESAVGQVEFFFAGAKLFRLDYQVTPTSSTAELLNKTYRPMDLRLRTGASWSLGGLAASATINFSDAYENTLVTPTGRVDSWLTADLQLRYDMGPAVQSSFLRDTTLALSVLNFTDEDPPSVQYGGLFANFNYDSANASPRGRFISLQLGKRW